MSGEQVPKGSTQMHSSLCSTITDYLRARRGWVLRVHGHLGQMPGTPDILACLPPSGRLIGVEVKTGRATLRPSQHRQKDAIEAAGGVWVLARSVDDVEDALLAAGVVHERIVQRGGRAHVV